MERAKTDLLRPLIAKPGDLATSTRPARTCDNRSAFEGFNATEETLFRSVRVSCQAPFRQRAGLPRLTRSDDFGLRLFRVPIIRRIEKTFDLIDSFVRVMVPNLDEIARVF